MYNNENNINDYFKKQITSDKSFRLKTNKKKNIIKKQNREINSKEIYSYMHDIFGAQIIDIFDLKQEEQETDSNESKEGGDALP